MFGGSVSAPVVSHSTTLTRLRLDLRVHDAYASSPDPRPFLLVIGTAARRVVRLWALSLDEATNDIVPLITLATVEMGIHQGFICASRA